MKKITSVILIIATILGIFGGVFFYKPTQVNGFWGIADVTFVNNITNDIKEFILDALPRTVAKYAIVRLQQEVARWAKGGFTDENAPFTMTNWGEEINNALDLASAKFIEKFNLTKFCSPLNYTLGEMFGIGIPYGGEVPYYEYAACTMDTIVDNVEAFWKNPSLAIYGWDAWSALSQPQNNIYGSFLMAATEKARLEQEEIDQKTLEKDTGSGYKNESECVEEQTLSPEELEKCELDCEKNAPTGQLGACYDRCDSQNTGICLKDVTKNLGSTIQSSMEKVVGSDIDWLISAKEITEMLNLVFSALFNKMINGLGLNSTTAYTPLQTTFKYNSEYSYYQNFKRVLTQEDINKLRTDILDSILKSIKSVATPGYTCDEKSQLPGDVYHELIVEILEQESQHLYVGMEGVDIKPDYIVLDNAFAVNAGIAIYGETWDDVPAYRYPDKCAKISGGGKCKDIVTKLPYDLKVENIKPGECVTVPPEYAPGSVGCLQALNKNRSDGLSDDEAIRKAMTDTCNRCWEGETGACETIPCCSSYAVGKQCLDAGYLVDGLKSACNECLKNGEQQCENIANATEKENCLKIHCSNYQNIPQINPASIPSAAEFYKRCQLVNLRESCNVCLKEYFMPASYCQEIDDFINRAFVKYPALVKQDSWFGRKNLSFPCEKNGSSGKQVPLGLICRILPDFGGVPKEQTVSGPGFSFTSTAGEPPPGEKNLCQKRCNVTYEELKSVIDNKPGDGDCSPIMYTVNATTPTSGRYIEKVKAKCCAALWWTGSDMSYQRCRDTEKQEECTWALPVDQEPWCYCDEGGRPLGFERTGAPPGGGNASLLVLPPDDDGDDDGDTSLPPTTQPPSSSQCGYADRGGDCADFSFDSPNRKVYGYTNNSPGGDVVYFAQGSCCETTETEDGDAVPPSGVISGCSWETGGDMATYECDLTGISGEIHAGVYHDEYPGDVSTGWHVCAPCNSSDAGYPFYGTSYDQCNGKAQ